MYLNPKDTFSSLCLEELLLYDIKIKEKITQIPINKVYFSLFTYK